MADFSAKDLMLWLCLPRKDTLWQVATMSGFQPTPLAVQTFFSEMVFELIPFEQISSRKSWSCLMGKKLHPQDIISGKMT